MHGNDLLKRPVKDFLEMHGKDLFEMLHLLTMHGNDLSKQHGNDLLKHGDHFFSMQKKNLLKMRKNVGKYPSHFFHVLLFQYWNEEYDFQIPLNDHNNYCRVVHMIEQNKRYHDDERACNHGTCTPRLSHLLFLAKSP